MHKDFSKRLYPNVKEFLIDIKFILQCREQMKTLMRGEALNAAFRERLMLAVTQVNNCRYCSYYHTKLALSTGVTADQIKGIAAQNFEHCPEEQRTALAYALHWAESDAKPDSQVSNLFTSTYGAATAELIELSLRVIRIGNLTGNLFDYILFKLSFGKIA